MADVSGAAQRLASTFEHFSYGTIAFPSNDRSKASGPGRIAGNSQG
jgi:hypothetical protein